ncbi:hypothetical protein Trco_008161 [Trichoderma cornu-damae]|uniref:Fcf2 pre-rRNA processing C-terminal domain-containing protein n=1 Tax=Trichoderma cornu-damae TaxID=654480 RepID=A0A9P8QDW0_9HYPO|nr:hypothetical protein Trco_008161 [Trichoderma cornu-damae]
MMAAFADNGIQELLQQAEQRLSGGAIVSKRTSTALTTSEPAGGDANSLAPKQEKAEEVRVPRAQIASERKGKNTAGPEWFDLPKTNMTPEFKRDWQLLRMRNVLDPKHQRKALRSSVPEYSQTTIQYLR